MSSPWAKIAAPEPVNLEEIMSEEVAKDLQNKEYEKCKLQENKAHVNVAAAQDEAAATDKLNVEPEIPEELLEEGDLKSDQEIAKMLQQQYDKEYDEMLKRTENKFNGASKVSISFSNYRRAPINPDFESDSEEEELEDLRDRKEWDRFDNLLKDIAAIPACGYRRTNGTMVTKHDMALSSRKNACKMMSFPPEFETGDGACFDLKLSNKVYNSLKVHSKQEQARRHRVHDKREEHATAEFGMDEYTRILLYKMINRGLLERVNGVISIGKEAVVLHADCDQTYPHAVLPKECVIKVFKTTLAEFKQRDKYIKDDNRFKGRIGKQTSRKTVHIWAEKEMANLYRVKRAGILCPEVVALKKHVLVMSFIGDDHTPAPKLKYAIMSDADYIVAYDQVVEAMKALYTKANLIHADLSEYNILWHKGDCYLIDVSQSVEPTHENAFYFLMRDCGNIVNFFSRKGLSDIMTPEQLFEEIVGCDFNNKMELMEVQEAHKMKPHLVDKLETTCSFENAWEKTKGAPKLEMETIAEPPLA